MARIRKRTSVIWVDIGPYLEHLGAVPLVDRDAVWLATAVFLADRTVDRPDSWERQLEIIVPSSNPEPWNAVGAEIEELLKFLTSDEWNVTFFQHESSTHKAIRSEGPAQAVSDLVCLFSGGADSLCAAVKALAEGHNVTLVSHWDDKGQRGIQKLLLADLERLFGEIPHVSVNLGRKRKHHEGASYQNEVSRRSRSLLFITLGLAVASARSKVPLWIGENGFVSLNPPLAPERRAAHSTRTTHPAFLRHLRKILRAVGAHTDFVPIYAGVTKGEMFMSVSDTIGAGECVCAAITHPFLLASPNGDELRSCFDNSMRCLPGMSGPPRCLHRFGIGRSVHLSCKRSRPGAPRQVPQIDTGSRHRNHAVSCPPSIRNVGHPCSGSSRGRRRSDTPWLPGTRPSGLALMLALAFHAHIDPKIEPSMLRELGGCVVAVTRSLSEFALVAERSDENVTWGLGAHPADPLSLKEFSENRFQSLIETVPVVGEVGLDRRSAVSLVRQQEILESIFRIIGERPRILNVHSAGATVRCSTL